MRETPFRWRGRGSVAIVSLVASVMPATGYAHPGHITSAAFESGLLHPWTGLDHVAAMLAVGLWATLMPNQSKLALFGATLVGIVAGTILGAYSEILTYGEQITAASVVVFGLFAAFAGHARKTLAAMVVALFCVGHGYVHTAEMPHQFSQASFSGGFLISMLALQLLGIAIAESLSRRTALARGAAAGFSVFGLVLLLS